MNKKYNEFPAGVYDTNKIFLQADPITGALQKVNLPAASGTYLLLAGGLMSGIISSINSLSLHTINNNGYIDFMNSDATLRTGYLQFNAAGSIIIQAENAVDIVLVGAPVKIYSTLDLTGELTGTYATFQNSVTGEKFIKAGGTASQILMADGSVSEVGSNSTIKRLRTFFNQESNGNTGNNNLAVYDIPANTVMNPGDQLEFIYYGQFVNATEWKSINWLIGNEGISYGSFTNESHWYIKIKITKTNGTSTNYLTQTTFNNPVYNIYNSFMVNLDYSQILSSGLSVDSQSTNKVIFRGGEVNFYKAET